jgi:hypothetical protein
VAQPVSASKIITDSKVSSPHNKITEDFMEKLASVEDEGEMAKYLESKFNDVLELFSNYDCRNKDDAYYFTVFFHKKGEIEISNLKDDVISHFANKYKNKIKVQELEMNVQTLLGNVFENRGVKYFLYATGFGGAGKIFVYKIKKG